MALGGLAGCQFTAGHAREVGIDAAPVVDVAPDAVPLQACLSDATYTDHNGHGYKVIAAGPDYDSAIDRCARDGAHLAVIDDSGEDVYVHGLSSDTWIGFDDLTTEGTFTWVTGAPAAYNHFTGSEPNNNNNEDCVYIKSDGTWNDTSCSDTNHAAVCECEAAYRPPPTPACRSSAGFASYKGRHYFLQATPRSWTDAASVCATTGAYLVVPSDDDENNFVKGLYTVDGWIGLSDQAVEGTFVWIDGAPQDYLNWASGSPMTGVTGDAADCVAASRSNGQWTDSACALTKASVCECDPLPP
jgi:hypothetical protein